VNTFKASHQNKSDPYGKMNTDTVIKRKGLVSKLIKKLMDTRMIRIFFIMSEERALSDTRDIKVTN